MLHLLQKLKLYTKLGSETVHKYSHQNLFMITCRLPTSIKIFLQLQYHIELLFHLQNQYQG